MDANEPGNRLFEFHSPRPAAPTGAQVPAYAPFILRREFAVNVEEKRLVREVTCVRLHGRNRSAHRARDWAGERTAAANTFLVSYS